MEISPCPITTHTLAAAEILSNPELLGHVLYMTDDVQTQTHLNTRQHDRVKRWGTNQALEVNLIFIKAEQLLQVPNTTSSWNWI